MADERADFTNVSEGAFQILLSAEKRKGSGRHSTLGLHHFLLALLERNGAMAEGMTDGLDSTETAENLRNELRSGNVGAPLDAETVVERARAHARQRGKSHAAERDFAAVILSAAEYVLHEPSSIGSASFSTSKAESTQSPRTDAGARAESKQPPFLSKFADNLTQKARDGEIIDVINRDEEIDLMIETICRRTKRNPLLIGHAGVGKTAIVEGLAMRIVAGEVPEPLKDREIWALQASSLVAGTQMIGELEKRMDAIIEEAQNSKVLLFIDEVHSIVGSGGRPGISDISSHLKPALARGELACLAATTDNEFRRYIEPDKALERRFQPIRVQQLNADQTLTILSSLSQVLEKETGVSIPEELLPWLVNFAEKTMRNRYFPDKGIDLLEQCVAHAVATGKKELTLETAKSVSTRMVGIPKDLEAQLDDLHMKLGEGSVVDDSNIESILTRLRVTGRGLDYRVERPNLVLMLVGEMANRGAAISAAFAVAFFGSPDREITIDLGRFSTHWDLTMLLGAAPGYIGHSEEVPLHKLAQAPWSVVRFENVDSCHPAIREVVGQALEQGFFTDSRGKRIYLSEAIVILTASIGVSGRRAIGFGGEDSATANDGEQSIETVFGTDFVDQVDLVLASQTQSATDRTIWIENNILLPLADRYEQNNLAVTWSADLVSWLQEQCGQSLTPRDWERVVEEKLAPLLIEHIPETLDDGTAKVVIESGESGPQVFRTEERSRAK